MKILVIFTGGTIASAAQNGWISPNEQAKFSIVENYKKSHADVEFACDEPYIILSENLCADNLNLLIKTVRDNLSCCFDGIIITHGTDTLQYTAAALYYAFRSAELPIMLVSSNFPLADSRANGTLNFECAVDFIRKMPIDGVWVSYKNSGENAKIHRANMLLSHPEMSDKIESACGGLLAEYKDGEFEKNPNYISDKRGENTIPQIDDFTLCAEPNILVIDSRPADNFLYNPADYNSVIFRPYHSGTLNTDNFRLHEFCRKAAECGTPLYVAGVSAGDKYASAREYENLGITALENTPLPAAYVKVWLTLSNK